MPELPDKKNSGNEPKIFHCSEDPLSWREFVTCLLEIKKKPPEASKKEEKEYYKTCTSCRLNNCENCDSICNKHSFKNVCEEFPDFIQKAVWRGHYSYKHALIPSIYREAYEKTHSINVIKTLKMFYFQAQSLKLDLKSMPKLNFKLGSNNYDRKEMFVGEDAHSWWSLAQHHDLPTPYLDWTYSPLIALFFASYYLFEKYPDPHRKIKDSDSKTVSVFALRRPIVMFDISEEAYETNIEKNVPTTGMFFKHLNFPENVRAPAQLGLFTCIVREEKDESTNHNEELTQVEKYDVEKFLTDKVWPNIGNKKFTEINKENNGENNGENKGEYEGKAFHKAPYLCKINITFKSKEEVKNCLFFLSQAGITNKTMFPDLKGLVSDIKYSFASDNLYASPVGETVYSKAQTEYFDPRDMEKKKRNEKKYRGRNTYNRSCAKKWKKLLLQRKAAAKKQDD